jgi:acyl carrier protein
MDNAVRKTVIDVLERETKVSINSIDLNAPIREQISIDSMQFITIIARLEFALKVTIPTTIIGVSTLNEFFDQIEDAINKNGK